MVRFGRASPKAMPTARGFRATKYVEKCRGRKHMPARRSAFQQRRLRASLFQKREKHPDFLQITIVCMHSMS